MKICHTCQQTYSDDVEFCPRDGAHLTAQATETEAQLAAGLSRRFRLVRRLGAGAMGTVFLAEQIAVGNRLVALKVLNRKLLDDPDFLLRFQNEAASTGRIHHPNVVTIYESGQADDGTPYIAMEFLEGESLRQALTRRGALPLPEVAEILQQAARGLNAAHKLGIIHRDLKPDNIFLTRGDEDETIVKVVDFGIAKLRESGAHTQTGMVLGTPAYMSFEQASGMRSDELDVRSDIYSLGVVTYEMLTGRAPFHSDTPVGYLRMHMQEDPPPFRTVKPELPALPQLESVVMKALTKNRDQRYGSVLEFARELASAAQSSRKAQSPVTIPPTRIVPPPALAKPPYLPAVTENPSRAKVAVLGLVLLAIIAAGIWYFSHSGLEPPPNVTSPSSGATVPVGQEPRLEVLPLPPGATQTPPTIPAPAAGTVRVNPKDGLKYVWIPPGTFMMGCSSGESDCNPDERPSHHVTISKGFWLGQTPVTVAAYRQFAGATKRAMPAAPDYNPGWDDQAMPIDNVRWDDAVAYCTWAGGRLSTEAEWEYAARAGSTQARYGPIDDIAWYRDNSGRERLGSTWSWSSDLQRRFKRLKENGNRPHDVAQKRPSAFNLYDMLGNVWEWVNDYYAEDYYAASPGRDPQGPGTGQYRVLRGGSWSDDPENVVVSGRARLDPSFRENGFRCLKELGSP
jgi:serine/threonine-protein kinase